MAIENVTLFHRNAQQAILAVRPFTLLEWTRRFAATGSFRAELPFEHGLPVQAGDVLDIELDGRTEFSGVVQLRRLTHRPQRQPVWHFQGMDLSWWLHQRVIVPPSGQSHDEQIGVPAEDAIRHYINDHLLNPTDPARAIPVPALLAPAHVPPLGPAVTVRARYGNLAKEIDRIAARAGLGYRAERDSQDRISFAVLAPRDRTATSPQPVIFATSLGTAEELTFTEATVRSRNAVYVLGDGSGATRLVQEVTDAADVAARARREIALDARQATSSAAAIDAGETELARQAAERLRLEARPPALSPLTYRLDWDVGDIVTLDLPDLSLRLDQRIEAVHGAIDSDEPLSLSCSFGAPSPDATDALRHLDERTAPGRFV